MRFVGYGSLITPIYRGSEAESPYGAVITLPILILLPHKNYSSLGILGARDGPNQRYSRGGIQKGDTLLSDIRTLRSGGRLQLTAEDRESGADQ